MRRNKRGLPKHCAWNTDRHGRKRVRFRKSGFSIYLTGTPWAAGCHGVSAHGLRKATARRLAEIGCSALQIAAITGHATLKEVQRYTNAADRKRIAREAMKKLIEGGW
jgi:integrase